MESFAGSLERHGRIHTALSWLDSRRNVVFGCGAFGYSVDSDLTRSAISSIERQQIFVFEFSFVSRVVLMKKTVLSIVLLIAVLSGCSSVISDSERFYKDQPRGRTNWREYTSK